MLRDYKANPLGYIKNGSVKYREKPFKEDVIELYINQNKSLDELCEYFNYNKRMFQRVLAEYGIKKDRKQVYQVQKQTLLKTKGVENVFQLKEVKKKSEKTNLEKYGKKHFVQTDEYKEKNLQTRVEKYGDDPFQREKYRQTCKEKFGVENFMYASYNDFQKRLTEDKDTVVKFIEDNNINNATEFSEKSGIKFYSTLTILHKFGLMNRFDYTNSSQEREIQQWLEQNNVQYVKHYKINKKEIDILVPDLKIGIEFNGNYWHSELCRSNNYHYEKSKLAEENGIFLYHIFEYEWNNIKEKILNQLSNLLQLNTKRIFARKCEIKEISKEDKKAFLEINHIQGNDHSKIYLGLYYENMLVSVMTFSKPHNTNEYEWELSRFCSLAGYNVIGGAGKLFKYFVDNYNPKSIISYSDIAKTKGNLYQTLGFNCIRISKPSYVWYKSGEVKSRYQTRVKHLQSLGFENKTENEIMHELGYLKIFDCGNKVWVYENN